MYAKCLNNADGIRVVAELPTTIQVLRCEFIPLSYGTGDRDLARDLERLERRKTADTSKIDELLKRKETEILEV